MAQQAPEFAPEPAATAEEMQSSGRELAPYDDRKPHVGVPAYKEFSAEMIQLIGKQVMPKDGFEPAELYMVLELAATYGLDPLAKEIWAIRMKAGDPVTIMVGVDGFQAIAGRHPDYAGFRNSEVYENDTFEFDNDIRELADGTFTHVTHKYDVTKDRGKLLGAYAEVNRLGKPPVFFWAPLAEYDRSGDNNQRSPWKRQKTAMIRKCALVNGLRRAFRISGLYIAEEMSNMPLVRNGARASADGTVETVAPEDAIRAMVEDEWTAQRLIDLFASDELRPRYLPAKQRLLLAGKDELQLAELVAQLEREIIDADGTPPAAPDPADFAAIDGTIEEPEDDIPFGPEDEQPPEADGEADAEEGRQTTLED